ncbi:peptidylprolyl isomerase [Martelella sp. AD-3]|uniref:peptidylprolyl isomerase n=1 Tax=Martelella sp. AD-3 TaxID=686597 RepID=UPI0004651CE5|nr:peptidylprolyl isomerase [Martelella sp. AD-3]AMM84756.1 hypothetical protein AZF01_10640 [Martelella sp. AD-3]
MAKVSTPIVEFICDFGAIEIELYPEQAPHTARNFLAYCDKGLLDGASVFRIVTPKNDRPERSCDSRAVQWGWRPEKARYDPALGRGWDPMDAPENLPFPPVPLETTEITGLRHKRGTVSMGRDSAGLSGPHFFFCVEDAPYFDFGGKRNPDGRGFAAFAQIVSGFEVLDRLYGLAEPITWMMHPYPIRSVRRKVFHG